MKVSIAKAVNAVGCRRSPSVNVKHAVYKVVVLTIMSCSSECWAVRANQICCLKIFHHHSLKSVLRVIHH